jgi:hypothetical protein
MSQAPQEITKEILIAMINDGLLKTYSNRTAKESKDLKGLLETYTSSVCESYNKIFDTVNSSFNS